MDAFTVVNNDFTQGDNGVILHDSTVSMFSVKKNGFTQGLGIEIAASDVSTLTTADNAFTQIDQGIVVTDDSSLSTLRVEDSEFTQLDEGVRVEDDTGISTFRVEDSEFTQTEYGIQVADLSTATEATVLETEFMQGGDSITMGSPSSSTTVSVVNGTFTQSDDAIRIEEPDGAPGTAIHCNTFVQVDYGVYAGVGAGTVDATNNIWNSLWADTRPDSPGGATLEDPVTGAPADGWSTYVSEGDTAGVSNVHFDGDHDTCPVGVNGDDETPPEETPPEEDMTPPETFDDYTGEAWETQAQPVEITCTDDRSGCSHIDWRIDRADGTELRDGSDGGDTTNVLVGAHHAGELILAYRGVDNAGNVEDWNEQRVRITLASSDDYTDDGWENTPQPVRLKCEHAEEKDCGLEWTIWDGSAEVRSGGVMADTTEVMVGTDADGPLVLEYWANDTDGNVEGPANEQRVRIDKIDPWVDLHDTDTWFGDDVTVSVEHGDHGYSGVDRDRCKYRTRDGDGDWSDWRAYDCEDITVDVGPDGDCSTTGEETCGVSTRVYDRAGNSNTTVEWYNIDLSAPKIDCDLHEDGCSRPEPVGAGNDVGIHPNVTDPYSGVSQVSICADASCEETFCEFYAPDDSCTFTTAEPYGSYTYCVRAVDRVGNEDAECGFAFSVKGVPGEPCTMDTECLIGGCEEGVCTVGASEPPGILLR